MRLDPEERLWEYDGDGTKIYKLKVGKGNKTPVQEADLDGGVPFKKDWIKESNENTKKLNGKG